MEGNGIYVFMVLWAGLVRKLGQLVGGDGGSTKASCLGRGTVLRALADVCARAARN